MPGSAGAAACCPPRLQHAHSGHLTNSNACDILKGRRQAPRLQQLCSMQLQMTLAHFEAAGNFLSGEDGMAQTGIIGASTPVPEQ